jgi:uncharacterized protein DUF4194
MSSPETGSDANPPNNGERADGQQALFAGDSGSLPLDTRRVLVQLLAGPSVDGRRHQKLWTTLLRDEAAIRARLSDVFLTLVVDRDQEVAFTRQAETEGLEVPVLLRRAQLTFIDSVLLLHLRERLARADSQDERAAISEDEMREFLSLYERKGTTDHAAFTKRIQNSIEKLKRLSILHRIRSSDQRYEIAPTLKLLFSVEEIQELTSLYRRMSAGDAQAADTTAEVEEEQ